MRAVSFNIREDTPTWKTPRKAEKGSMKTLRAQRRVTDRG